MTISSDTTTSDPSLGAAPSKILVTGGKGNFGATVVRELAGYGEVILTDISPEIGDEPVAYHQADLTDFPRVLQLMQGIDTVVHLAVVAINDYLVDPPLGPLELDPYHEKILAVNPRVAYNVLEGVRWR